MPDLMKIVSFRHLALLVGMGEYARKNTRTIPTGLVPLMRDLQAWELVGQATAQYPETGWYITELGLEVLSRLERDLETYARVARAGIVSIALKRG